MARYAPDDLLTPEQAADALGGHVEAQTIRKRIKKGDLKCHWRQDLAGRIFVKRSELMALYDEKINGWKGVKR